MHRDTRHFTGPAPASHPYEVGSSISGIFLGGFYANDVPVAPTFDAAPIGTNYGLHSPLNRFEFQPLDACPKNFIIFDQTDQRSKVMFHPAMAHKFSHGTFKVCAFSSKEGGEIMTGNTDNHDKVSSFKEDTKEINALLSSEEDHDEDDDIISTGRTETNFRVSFPDSIDSVEALKPHEVQTTSTSDPVNGVVRPMEMKKERMKQIVDVLRKFLPGGDQLDSIAVLDEADNYLMSIKAELQNLGIQNFNT